MLRWYVVTDVLQAPVLVLNPYYQPVRRTTVRQAFHLLARGAARALTRSGRDFDFEAWVSLPARRQDEVVPTVSDQIRAPQVLRLVRGERIGGLRLALSHRNVMLRDEFQCQYCGARPGHAALNIDHVIPRSRGGKDTWDNLVTACKVCNVRKGRRTPEECGMRLLRPPRPPRMARALDIVFGPPPRHDAWEPYLRAG